MRASTNLSTRGIMYFNVSENAENILLLRYLFNYLKNI